MRIKNLNLNRKLISLTLASVLGFSLVVSTFDDSKLVNYEPDISDASSSIANEVIPEDTPKETEIIDLIEDEPVVIEEPVDIIPNTEGLNILDIDGSARLTSNLNLRVGPTTNFEVIRTVKKDTEPEILGVTDDNWFIIKDENDIGYVSGEHVSFTPSEDITPDGKQIHKFIYTIGDVNFRSNPDIDSEIITTFPLGTRLEYLGYVDENWYMIRYDNHIGYVSSELVDFIDPNNTYRNDFIKVIYATEDIGLKESPDAESSTLYGISEKEACEVLREEGDWYVVRCNHQIGYIPKVLTEELTGVFVVVDISEQILTLYDGNIILLEVDITSGTKGVDDTPYGLFSIQNKIKDYYLKGPGYRSHVDFWMPFYYGYGIHDASWRTVFGKNYYERHGSHGCVNVPPERTEEIYETVEVGTKVLVHK